LSDDSFIVLFKTVEQKKKRGIMIRRAARIIRTIRRIKRIKKINKIN